MQQPVQIIATEAIIDDFIQTCKTLDIKEVTIFLQSHISFFRVQTPAGYPHTTQDFILTLIRKCETFDISEEHKKRMIELIKTSFNAFQQFHNILYSEWLNQEDQEGINFHEVGYNYVVTDFVHSLNSIGFRSKCMLSDGEWHKPLIEYFLSTCQFDHAFAVSGLIEYRNLVLTTGEFLEKNSYGSPFCQCGVDHLSLIRSKLKTLEETDSQLEEAASRGDKKQVNLLLVQGDPLRAIAGAIRQKNLKMIVDITNRYHFISNITIPILKQLADAKLDEMFCDYLDLICNNADYVGNNLEELIGFTAENGLVESTFSLIDRRVRQLSLPPIGRVYNYAGHYDSLFDNLPPQVPVHHRSVINATLQIATAHRQTHLVAVLGQWQSEVERHYPNIEQLIIQDTDSAIEILNRYSIDYRYAFRAIIMYSRMELFEKLLTAYNLFLSKSNRMSLDNLFSFCGYLAFKYNRGPAVRFLLRRISNKSKFAIDSIAAGNFVSFQALFRHLYDSDYKKAAYHFGKQGLSIFPMLVNNTSEKVKSILKKAILGAIHSRKFDLLPDILKYCRQHELDSSNIFAVIGEVAEYDLICILTLLSDEQDIQTIVQCAIKNKSLDQNIFTTSKNLCLSSEKNYAKKLVT